MGTDILVYITYLKGQIEAAKRTYEKDHLTKLEKKILKVRIKTLEEELEVASRNIKET